MAGSRTLKLSILADVDDLRKKLGDGGQDVETFGTKLEGFGKKAGLAFAAAGVAAAAYAGKLAIDGVKSAIEDEAAQNKLAGTLERVAGASKETVAAVEQYILKTSLAKGVTDDQLRPAFDRLVRSASSVKEAQDALNISLDISKATGKDLETVTAAVGRAMDGSTAALGKLGLGFEQSELKGKSFSDLLPMLTERFGGAAAAQAETFQGKIDRIGIAFSEAKETVGGFILDAITPLFTLLVDQGIPTLITLGDTVGNTVKPIFDDIQKFITDKAIPAFKLFWSFLSTTLIPVLSGVFKSSLEGIQNLFRTVGAAIDRNSESFKKYYETAKPIIEWLAKFVAPILSGVVSTAFKILGSSLSIAIDAFGLLANAITRVVDGIKAIINTIKSNPIVSGISGIIDKVFGGGKATGGFVSSNNSYLVGEKGPELFVPSTSGTIVPNNALGGSPIINLNVTGAIDPEGTARTIIQVLNDSFARGTLGSLAFRS